MLTQDQVDNVVLESEKLVDKVWNEETALDLLKRIEWLHLVSKHFFVPDIVVGWEEMAMSYIQSPQAIFIHIHYPQVVNTHKEGYKTFAALEEFVLTGELEKDKLFSLIQSFNRRILRFNQYCDEYGQEQLPIYKLHSSDLSNSYNKWIEEIE